MNKSTLLVFTLLFLASCTPSDPEGEITSPGNSPVPVRPELPPSVDGSDPLAAFAWHLHNTGQSSFASRSGRSGEDARIKDARELGFSGRGIRIAVSDSGTEVSHPDLVTNNLVGEHRNYSGPPREWHGVNPTPEEKEAHGTAVAGLIAAEANNGIGSYGVAPESQYAAFYFLGRYRDNTASYEARTLDQLNGDFDIFNYSYGYPGCSFFPTSSSIIAAYKYGVTQLRNGLGAIYVKAAGNEFQGQNSQCYSGDRSTYWGNANTSEDQTHPYLVVTAAANAMGEISSYSSPGSTVWITSLGGEFGSSDPAMITTDIQGCNDGLSSLWSAVSGFNRGSHNLNPNCSYTSIMNGTSSAAPTLSGIIALMLEANPSLTWRDVKHILAKTADPIRYSTNSIPHPGGLGLSGHTYDQVYTVNAAGIPFSNTFGFGRVNALKAVSYARDYDFPLSGYQETETNGKWDYRSGNINLSIPDGSSAGVRHSLKVIKRLKVESVQIKLSVQHPKVGELGVELTSPSGTVSRILLINSNIKDRNFDEYVLLSNAFYQEESVGDWTLKVIDASRGNTGKLLNWELKVNGGSL